MEANLSKNITDIMASGGYGYTCEGLGVTGTRVMTSGCKQGSAVLPGGGIGGVRQQRAGTA